MRPRRPLPGAAAPLAFRVSLACVAFAVGVLLAPTALAHVAIQLHIERPASGARVGPHAELVVYAQPMLFGVPETTFVVELDGRPLDPRTGRPGPAPRPVHIVAGRRVTVPLRGLGEGRHELTLRYRPDRDALPLETSVTFVVGRSGSRPLWPLAGAGLGLAVLGGATAARRRRSGHGRRGYAARGRRPPSPTAVPTNSSAEAASPPSTQGPGAGASGAASGTPRGGPPPSMERS